MSALHLRATSVAALVACLLALSATPRAAAQISSCDAGGECTADLDRSGDVGFSDLLQVLTAFGCVGLCPEDLDGDRIVGFSDLLIVLTEWGPCPPGDVVCLEMAGDPLADFPHFHFVRAFNEGSLVHVAIDPGSLLAPGAVADVYIVEAKTQPQWIADPVLADVRGAPQTETFAGATIQDNTFALSGSDALSADAGADVGVGYDLVADFNLNGLLDPGDYIDGFSDEAGFYVVRDLTSTGPLTVTSINYTVTGVTPGFTGERTWYPADIASMGQLPLVVVSHGNGHQYTWYDYLQKHLASYGFVVMSHQNNTSPGIETASTTTLQHTDAFLGQLSGIGGGELEGHVDSSRIIWIGHSRGGEGIVRAYDRIFDGFYTPANYDLEDILLLLPISPTDFLGFSSSNPHQANYHLLYGSADGDVEGNPSSSGSKPFSEFERGEGTKHLTYLQGADHNDFNCCGFDDFDGPPGTAIGRDAAQTIAKGYYLVTGARYAWGNVPALDYLQRLYEDIRPAGADGDVAVAKEYRDALTEPHFRLDDYQTQGSTSTSSSGGTVAFDVDNVAEGSMIDTDGSFAFHPGVPFNGMTRSKNTLDNAQCVVFDWPASDARFYELEVIASERDFSDNGSISFRACQGTRHPQTDALDAPLSFTVTLRDGDGITSSIDFDEYGRITRPYPRTGFGGGAGWANEFNTVRIRLKDFTHNGTGLDLTNIVAVRFEFGSGFGSPQGRIGLDDIEITVQ